MPKENFDCKLITIKNVLKNWDKRNLTPIGKIVVLKTLALPILNHICISLPTPAENQMKELENLAFSFIWGHKTDRIKRYIITRDYSQGSLRMVNIKLFIQSLKLSWIRRLIFEKKEWKHFIEMHISTPRLVSCGSQYASQISSGLGNKFWKEVFKICYFIISFTSLWMKHLNHIRIFIEFLSAQFYNQITSQYTHLVKI